jgi:uncharacterized protein (TIGR03437 family)
MRTDIVSTALFLLFASQNLGAQTSEVVTFAGTGTAGFSGDGGPATQATFNGPVFVATDPAGNTYIADEHSNRIRKVDPTGIVTTVAGTGAADFSGDGGPATQAAISNISGVVADGFGNFYIADVGNSRIRKVDAQGVITTVAGNGAQTYGGDGGPATAASFRNAVRVVLDPAGNLYIADQSNHRIRKVDTNGIITTFAGTGVQSFSGDGGLAVNADLNNPTAVALDPAGNLYFSDQFNQRIRRVDGNGVITTIAGNGNAAYTGDGGAATAASLNYPGGLIIDSTGDIFIADDNNFVVREITPDGIIHTVAGNGTAGYAGDGGPPLSAEFNGQFGLAIDPHGNLIIADQFNNRVRELVAASSVAPVFTSGSVTNAASYAVGGSAGDLAVVFGTHLSVNVSGVLPATATPLPLKLGGASITVNGVSAPILAVVNINGTEQINFQMPWEAAGQTTVDMVVNNGVTASAAIPVAMFAAQPAVFNIGGGNGAVEHVSGVPVSTASPAAPSEIVVVFANGMGPVSPALITGQPTPAALFNTTFIPTVTIGGLPATVEFSGAAPYFVGLNQLNVQVPPGAPAGNQNLVITSNGIVSNTVTIAIQ